MMKRTTLVAICLLVAFFAAKAGAQNDAADWQIGGSVVTSQLSRDDGLIDNPSFGFRAHAQYKFNTWIGLQGAYYNSGKFSTDAILPGDPVDLVYQGGLVQGIVYIPFPLDDLELFVKGGYYNFTISSAIGGDNTGNGTDNGAVIGAGLSLRMTDSMSVRTEFDWYNTDGAELWTVAVGLAYHF